MYVVDGLFEKERSQSVVVYTVVDIFKFRRKADLVVVHSDSSFTLLIKIIQLVLYL